MLDRRSEKSPLQRRSPSGASLLGLAVAVAAAGLAIAGRHARSAESREVVWPAPQIPFKQVRKGVAKADLWGDSDRGAHGSLTRFSAGARNPLHTHTYDVKVVPIEGTFVYGRADGQDVRVGPGEFLLVPGGTRHTSGCAPGADCLFFEEQPGRFDMQQVVGDAR